MSSIIVVGEMDDLQTRKVCTTPLDVARAIVEHIFWARPCAGYGSAARLSGGAAPEFDAGGYDLVMSCGKIERHIQFKSTVVAAKRLISKLVSS